MSALAAPPGPAEVKDTVKKAFTVDGEGTLHLDLDHGNIDIETIGGDRVLVVIERIADADSRDDAQAVLDQHEYFFEQQEDDVYIRSRFEEGDGFWKKWRGENRLKIHVRVQVPERYNVSFKSGAGNVVVRNLVGTVEGRTGAGNVELTSIDGSVDVTSGAGNVEVSNIEGYAYINTGAGNISLQRIEGAVKAHTGAGNVSAEIVDQPDRASYLKTGAGNVSVRLADDVAVYVDASAGMGSCETDFPLRVEGKWLKRSFSGQINGGGPEIRMSAGVGNVSLLRY